MKSVYTGIRFLSLLSAASVAGCAFQSIFTPLAAADPLQGGVSDTQVIQGASGSYEYPAPQMVQPMRPMQGSVRSQPPLQGGAGWQQHQPPPPRRPPMQMNVQKIAELPPGYLGVWLVGGNRTTVDAVPEFQDDANRAFSPMTQNKWQISGNPGNYSMGNGEMSTQLIVDRVGPDGTAFIRYQHPMGRNGATSAQEAIVLSLSPDGRYFSGLERISIVKNGGPPRCKVTYQLKGQRQR